MLADYFNIFREWFLSLGESYGVNPIIFGSIYVGAIPFFTLSIGWLVKNYRAKKSIVLPALSSTFFFVSAYVYLIIAGENVPVWVYALIALMVGFGAYSTFKKVQNRIQEAPNTEEK